MGETETLSGAIPRTSRNSRPQYSNALATTTLTITTAESCTGGLLASLLTDVEGRSHAFERGFVVYSEAAKSELLGVPADTDRT